MKYRIKITTYENGRRSYVPQFRGKLYWIGINYKGEAGLLEGYEMDKREQALSAIDNHYAGNTKQQHISFEYINK